MTIENFSRLWLETQNMVSYHIKSLIASRKSNIEEAINSFYRIQILDNLWFSESFANDYSQFMESLKAESLEKYEKVKACLYDNRRLVNSGNTDNVIKTVLLSGATGSLLLGFLKKNIAALAASVGFGALLVLLNKKQKEEFVNQVSDIVSKRLNEIGEDVISILKKSEY